MNRWGKLAYGIRDHRRFVGLPRQDLGVAIWAIAWSGEIFWTASSPRRRCRSSWPTPRSPLPAWCPVVSREPVEGGYQIHHFSDYNEVRSKVETDREANHAARVRGGQRRAAQLLATTGSALPPGASNHPDRQAAPARLEIKSQAARQGAPKVDVDVDVDVEASSRTRGKDDDERCPLCQRGSGPAGAQQRQALRRLHPLPCVRLDGSMASWRTTSIGPGHVNWRHCESRRTPTRCARSRPTLRPWVIGLLVGFRRGLLRLLGQTRL